LNRFAIRFGIATVALILLAILLHRGPAREPQAFPRDHSVTDYHVHVAGIGAGDSGCFISPSLRESYKFGIYLEAMGVSLEEIEQEGDQLIFQRLSERLARSRYVRDAVVLALDGVIVEGQLDPSQTEFYVPNAFVSEGTAAHANLRYGASINPYRSDAIPRLRQAKQDGAVLIKWIPSIMMIDPADPQLEAFYREMARLELPLLSHTGQERSFTRARDELADPIRLAYPLELGVTVIAAHVATTGITEGESNFERLLPMFERYPRLYADISSLTQVNKLGYLRKVVQRPDLDGRLIYGTDWPLPFFPLVSRWYHWRHMHLSDLWAIGKHDNQWDRDIAIKRAMGVPTSVFTNQPRTKFDSQLRESTPTVE